VRGPDFFEPRGKLTVEPPDWNKRNPDWQKVHLVRVHEQTCTCGLYQDYLIPCCYTLAALYHCGISLQDKKFHLIPPWFDPISILIAYDYIEIGQNEWDDDVIVHTGLQAVDITSLAEYAIDDAVDLPLDDLFADLVVEPPEVPKHQGRRRTKR
jgi:hypothetical protein